MATLVAPTAAGLKAAAAAALSTAVAPPATGIGLLLRGIRLSTRLGILGLVAPAAIVIAWIAIIRTLPLITISCIVKVNAIVRIKVVALQCNLRARRPLRRAIDERIRDLQMPSFRCLRQSCG